jgi:hypothetical protein
VDVLFWTGRRQCGCFILDCMQKRVERIECGCLFWSVSQDQVDRRQCKCLTVFKCAEDNVEVLQDLHVLKTM